MRGVPLFVLLALLAVSFFPAPAASPATTHARTVEAVLAYPTPLGPLTALDDQHAWDVIVPPATVVYVEAQARGASPFHLRATRADAPDEIPLAAPALRDGVALHTPGPWRVRVDPTGGADVHIDVFFTGYFGDIGGAPAPFEVEDRAGPNPCVVPGACLP